MTGKVLLLAVALVGLERDVSMTIEVSQPDPAVESSIRDHVQEEAIVDVLETESPMSDEMLVRSVQNVGYGHCSQDFDYSSTTLRVDLSRDPPVVFGPVEVSCESSGGAKVDGPQSRFTSDSWKTAISRVAAAFPGGELQNDALLGYAINRAAASTRDDCQAISLSKFRTQKASPESSNGTGGRIDRIAALKFDLCGSNGEGLHDGFALAISGLGEFDGKLRSFVKSIAVSDLYRGRIAAAAMRFAASEKTEHTLSYARPGATCEVRLRRGAQDESQYFDLGVDYDITCLHAVSRRNATEEVKSHLSFSGHVGFSRFAWSPSGKRTEIVAVENAIFQRVVAPTGGQPGFIEVVAARAPGGGSATPASIKVKQRNRKQVIPKDGKIVPLHLIAGRTAVGPGGTSKKPCALIEAEVQLIGRDAQQDRTCEVTMAEDQPDLLIQAFNGESVDRLPSQHGNSRYVVSGTCDALSGSEVELVVGGRLGGLKLCSAAVSTGAN